MDEPVIRKRVDSFGAAYYTVRWSPLTKVDKFTIIKNVPAMAGIFELYFQDDKKKLNRFYIAKVWIGGLRSTLRKLTDPLLQDDERWIDVLKNRKCFFRYTLSESFTDISDVLFFFGESFAPGRSRIEHSERYCRIFVEELSPDKIVTI